MTQVPDDQAPHEGVPQARRAACERIARDAGDLVRSRFGRPGRIDGKGDSSDPERLYDVVTEVDYLSESLILEHIGRLNPDAVVLAEEGGMLRADRTPLDADELAHPAQADELWLIDPLDGTVNFAHDVPHFCVSVACWRRGEPVAGAIVDPMVGETFSFSWDDPVSGAARAAFHDGGQVWLDDSVPAAHTLVYIGGSGGSRLVPLMRHFQSWRRLGSAALALAWTGVGRCGAYVQPGNLHPWDWGVGVPFVQAAGGVVCDGHGGEWTNSIHGTSGVIVSTAGVRAELDGVLRELAAV